MEDLLIRAANLGVKFKLEGDELRVTAPRGALTPELQQDIRQHKQALLALLRHKEAAEDSLPQLPDSSPDDPQRWAPFPLTDLQHAYWVGRDSSMVMGSVATHLYVELDCQQLDLARLNRALCQMIERHPMLRAVVDREGMQRILPEVPAYHIALDDQSGAAPAAAEAAVLATREALSHQVLAADQWPLFDIRATRLSGGSTRLHVSLDLLILDAWSIFLFFSEWHSFYQDPNYAPAPLRLHFRDYALAEQAWKNSRSYANSYAYWMRRLEDLPAAPEMPIRPLLDGRNKPRFSRREARIPKASWQLLKQRARERGITPSSLLLAAYSEVLARWSRSPHFSVNVTIANRMPFHPEVNQLIGDFTTPMLQEIDRRDASLSFGEFAARLQRQFAQDMQHLQVSGVIVLREWAKRRGVSAQAAMPVVFSSGLIWSGDQEPGDLEQFGKKVASVSQTSQVWLDHHVMELQGDLCFVWDAVDAVFEPGVLDAMFDAYCQLVRQLAEGEQAWDNKDPVSLPAPMLEQRIADHCTQVAWQPRHLHAGFIKQALHHPEATALVCTSGSISYGQLLGHAAAIADYLLAQGLAAAEPVAVVMHKGWEQIAAVMGILLAGGAYMPIDASLPPKRQEDLLAIGAVRLLLCQPQGLNPAVDTAPYQCLAITPQLQEPFSARHQASLQLPLEQLAYVIFTSGTTGVPKGVMISHRAAMNTIEQVNRLLGLTAQDRVLAVSSLSFDLSVYDIFGLLEVGGALVIPDASKGQDAVHWQQLIQAHGVSLWNSAPQLMGMLMDALTGPQQLPLRAVLMSGDFIALDLPERIVRATRQAQVISLGGATEASIWSNYFPVAAVAPHWKSIPYGKALPNQTMQVFDQAFRPCPDYAKGKIYIGGEGLAIAYWQDPEKTRARFVTHPVSGERLYDTGDLGYYLPDGNIVIIGRDDAQVKVRGHRIELGEIEAALRDYPEVRQAVVLATAPATGQRQLVAYLEPERGASLDTALIRAHLAQRLPDYMIPRHMVSLARLPVTANGKLDHRALPDPAELVESQAGERVLPRTPGEQQILAIWGRVITGVELGVTDNFFELGGDSVMATSLVRELNEQLPGFNLEMHELFENLTIEALAVLYEARSQGGATAAAQASAGDEAAMCADLEALKAEFAGLAFDLPLAPSQAAVLLTGATGWIGSHLLLELLQHSQAPIYCLVRAHSLAEARARLLQSPALAGVALTSSQEARLQPLCGDLSLSQFGLADAQWQTLASQVGQIYHLGADVNLVADYASHRSANLLPLSTLARLATQCQRKQINILTPMTACRRQEGDRVVFHHQEARLDQPQGLLTAYAQSKWALEQAVFALGDLGLPVKIYRSSHALPHSKTGQAKPRDTHGSVLKLAWVTGLVPDWDDSAVQGLPVDLLAQWLRDISLRDNHPGPIHLENPQPTSIPEFVAACSPQPPSRVSLGDWQQQAQAQADRLAPDEALVIKLLFANRAAGTAIHHMFARHPVDTRYWQQLAGAGALPSATPAAYWAQVAAAWGQAGAVQGDAVQGKSGHGELTRGEPAHGELSHGELTHG